MDIVYIPLRAIFVLGVVIYVGCAIVCWAVWGALTWFYEAVMDG